MTRLNRAKIFAPFAALAGFDERVSRKEITYVPRREPDADEEWAVNRRLFELHGLTANSRQVRAGPVRVCVEYFVPCDDMENAAYGVGGRYETLTGVVLKVDPREQRLLLRGESGDRAIPFSDIYRISAPSG